MSRATQAAKVKAQRVAYLKVEHDEWLKKMKVEHKAATKDMNLGGENKETAKDIEHRAQWHYNKWKSEQRGK